MYAVTWLIDAYMLREKSVKAHRRTSFEAFAAMTPRTKRYWITQAKRNYLDSLKRVR